MRILGIDHVVVRCRDLAPMLAFYTTVLGCTVARRNEPLGLIHLRAGSAQIDLVDIDGELGRT
jgi:glyoxylase I family protein